MSEWMSEWVVSAVIQQSGCWYIIIANRYYNENQRAYDLVCMHIHYIMYLMGLEYTEYYCSIIVMRFTSQNQLLDDWANNLIIEQVVNKTRYYNVTNTRHAWLWTLNSLELVIRPPCLGQVLWSLRCFFGMCSLICCICISPPNIIVLMRSRGISLYCTLCVLSCIYVHYVVVIWYFGWILTVLGRV